MVQQIRKAERVLVVASPAYARRAQGDAEPNEGRGVQWEARLIREMVYSDERAGLRRVLPVVLPGCSPDDIPWWLSPASVGYYRVSEFTIPGAEKLLRVLTHQPLEIEPPLGRPPSLPPRSNSIMKPPACHVIVWTDSEETREQAAETLHNLGLDPTEAWCTARAVSYRVNSGQTHMLRSQMEETDFSWTVVAPGLEDYLLHQLHIEGPDGRRFRVFDTPAHQSIDKLIAEVTDQYPGSYNDASHTTVADQLDQDGRGRRLDPNDTLHMAGVRDEDRIRISFQVSEWREHRGYVFISYVRENMDQVHRLRRLLEAANVRVWLDSASLWPGEDWRLKIRRAITDDALVFIACFSRQSVARQRSYQNEELLLGIEQMRLRRPDEPWLIPVRFDDCSVPDWDIGGGRSLASLHSADLFGENADLNAARLVEAVWRILGNERGHP
jgi:hypothetical protein